MRKHYFTAFVGIIFFAFLIFLQARGYGDICMGAKSSHTAGLEKVNFADSIISTSANVISSVLEKLLSLL